MSVTVVTISLPAEQATGLPEVVGHLNPARH